MAEMTTQVGITAEQYRALQPPVNLPTPRQLFDFEVERLVTNGLATYAQADPFRKDVPSGFFLFVPPRPEDMDLNHLVSLIEVNGKSYLNEQFLTDEIEVPPAPYLAQDVEDGNGRRNTKPSVNRTNILAEHRSPGLTYEGLVHCIVFPEVLKHHFIYLVGSRYRSEDVPGLYLCYDGPRIGAIWGGLVGQEWGGWSCGSRRGARG